MLIGYIALQVAVVVLFIGVCRDAARGDRDRNY
jgi:hypothetical protein